MIYVDALSANSYDQRARRRRVGLVPGLYGRVSLGRKRARRRASNLGNRESDADSSDGGWFRRALKRWQLKRGGVRGGIGFKVSTVTR